MMNSTSGKFFKTTAFLALLTCITCGRAWAAFPKLEWLYRVKPDIVPQSLVFMDEKTIALQSERNVVHFIDADTGRPLWRYALNDRAEMYPASASTLLALAGDILHSLDFSAKQREWSVHVCTGEGRTIYLSPDASAVTVHCPDGKNMNFSFAAGTRSGAPGIPEGARQLHPDHAAEFNPSLLGEDTNLSLQGDTAALYSGKIQSLTWSWQSKSKLSSDAALLGGRLMIVSAQGDLIALDPATGKAFYTTDLTKTIDMRFWDELPQRINNYSAARIFTRGDYLYILPPSGICKIRIMAFPPEITLKGATLGPADSTQQWALNKAIQSWDDNDFASALVGFKEAAQVWPDSPEVLMFTGMAYSALREANPQYLDMAISQLEAAQAIAPDNPDVSSNLVGNYMLKVMMLDQTSQRDQIIDIYRKMLNSDPYSAVSHVGLTEVYLSTKDNESAVKVMRESYASGFFGPDQANLLISALYLEDDRQGIMSETEKAISFFPKSRIPYILAAKTMCKQGIYGQAAQMFRIAPPDVSQLVPEMSTFPRMLAAGAGFFQGNAIGLSGHYAEAIKVLADYLAWLPTNKELEDLIKQTETRVSNDGSRSYNEASTTTDARFRGKSALELQSEVEFKLPALLTLAHFYFRTGNTAKSLKYLADAEKSAPKDNDALSYVGYYYALNGKNLSRALDYTSRAYKASPDDVVYVRNYAVALWKNKRTADAEKTFNEAVALKKSTEFMHFDYGQFLLENKRKPEAIEQFKKELDENPELFEARNIYDKLAGQPKTK